MPASSGTVDADGTAIHYLDWEGSGPPLILIHATGFLGALWRPIAERLADRFRVIAIDQRGHGDSDAPASGYTFETFARDLQRVIEALRLDRPLAAGHSAGGSTIVVHAAAHPGVISRAVLIEPILPRPDWFTDPPPEGRTNASLADGARKRRAVWRDAGEAFASYRKKETFRTWREDVLRCYVEEGMRRRDDGRVELKCSPEVEGLFFDAVRGPDFWSLLPEVRCPALFLWGGESHLHGRGLGAAADAVPNGRNVIVPGATHFLPQERPDEVARLMQEYFAD